MSVHSITDSVPVLFSDIGQEVTSRLQKKLNESVEKRARAFGSKCAFF